MSSNEPTIVACPACGARNRVDPSAAGRAVCGRCKSPLSVASGQAAASAVPVTDATFDAEVLRHPGFVLVDAWAPWCGPCRILSPVVDQIARERAGRLKVAKLNTDENPATASRYGIRSIPTLLLLRGGQVVDQAVGALPKARLESWLAQHGA